MEFFIVIVIAALVNVPEIPLFFQRNLWIKAKSEVGQLDSVC
jgi:hypothetical protein